MHLEELFTQIDNEYFDLESRVCESDDEESVWGHQEPATTEQHDYDDPQSSLDRGDSAHLNSDILVHNKNQNGRDNQASCTERPAEQPRLPSHVQDQPTNGATAMTELDPSMSKRQNVLKSFDCGCKADCLSQFDPDSLLNQLVYIEAMTPSEKDIVIQ